MQGTVSQTLDEFYARHPQRIEGRVAPDEALPRFSLSLGALFGDDEPVLTPPHNVVEWRTAPLGTAVGDHVTLFLADGSRFIGTVIAIGQVEVWIASGQDFFSVKR